MPSTRESVLLALKSALDGGLTCDVLRNEPLAQTVPAVGLAILRDGAPGEPIEVTLSPLTYHYDHAAELELYTSDASRDATFDARGVEIAAALAADRTLGGLCDWVEAGPPESEDLAVDGGASIKAAVIPIYLHYATTDPLD